MGYQKIKRPILATGGLEVSGGSTFTGAVTAVTQSGSVTFSGIGPVESVQSLSSGSTATVINNYGVTTIYQTAAGTTDQTWKLAAPTVGVRKSIIFSPGARTLTFTCTAAGTDPFYNSTDTTSLVATSDADDFGGMGVIDLVGVTSLKTGATGTKWGIIRLTTAITIT